MSLSLVGNLESKIGINLLLDSDPDYLLGKVTFYPWEVDSHRSTLFKGRTHLLDVNFQASHLGFGNPLIELREIFFGDVLIIKTNPNVC